MRLRSKIGASVLAQVAAALSWLGISVSHDSPCPAALSPPAHPQLMQAITYRCYGPSEVLMIQAGKLTPLIDRSYALSELPAAIRYLELGHARGKIVIDVP